MFQLGSFFNMRNWSRCCITSHSNPLSISCLTLTSVTEEGPVMLKHYQFRNTSETSTEGAVSLFPVQIDGLKGSDCHPHHFTLSSVFQLLNIIPERLHLWRQMLKYSPEIIYAVPFIKSLSWYKEPSVWPQNVVYFHNLLLQIAVTSAIPDWDENLWLSLKKMAL